MSADRLNVFPSEAVKKAMKDRLGAAKAGLKLLKKKSDAIKVRLHQQMKMLKEIKDRLGDSMKDAYYSHSEATWAAGDFNGQVLESVPNRAVFRVQTTLGTFSGVKIPSFSQLNDNYRGKDQAIGVARGGLQIKKCQQRFEAVLADLVALASLQTSTQTLDAALQVTNRRVNALEFVIIPRFTNTLSYIESELDEGEREDQNRIKKVKAIRELQNSKADRIGASFKGAAMEAGVHGSAVDHEEEMKQDEPANSLEALDAGLDQLVGSSPDLLGLFAATADE